MVDFFLVIHHMDNLQSICLNFLEEMRTYFLFLLEKPIMKEDEPNL
jgi:hypothetical protein